MDIVTCQHYYLPCRLFILGKNWEDAEQMLMKVLLAKDVGGKKVHETLALQTAFGVPTSCQSEALSSQLSSSVQVV